MSSSKMGLLLILSLFAAVGCSHSGSDETKPAATAAAAPATAASSPSTAAGGNVCTRNILSFDDASGVLGQPVVATKEIPGDPQSCKFSTAGQSGLTVSVRPGHGKSAVGMYAAGKMDEFDKSAPMPGIGDEAFRSLSLQRVIARKGDLLCEITGSGLAAAGDDPVEKKIGDLCNKIFAAY